MPMTMKAARVNAGIRQEEAANSIGIAPSTLSKWENGRAYPNALQLSALCKIYNISMDDIIFLQTQST